VDSRRMGSPHSSSSHCCAEMFANPQESLKMLEDARGTAVRRPIHQLADVI
jgi:hypothetical protein